MHHANDRLLPARQAEVLTFIRDSLAKNGYVPSIREMCMALGLRSTSTVHVHLTGLAQRGLIRWDKGKTRAIQILDGAAPEVPPGVCPHCRMGVDRIDALLAWRTAALVEIETLSVGCPTAEREAAARYGDHWRDIVIDRIMKMAL